MNIKHFEDLWNESEKLLSKDLELSDLTNALSMKITLMKSILDSYNDSKEFNEAVSKLFGEVLFSLSQISSKTNINVYKAMLDTFKLNQIDYFEEKHK